jgi:hypothetical protein
MPYLIRFENDPKFATAPAIKVVIELPVDEDVNLFSVRLGDFGFANMTFSVPTNTTAYTTRLDVRDSLGVYVDVTAGIDVPSKKVFWIFESVDPITGVAPTSTTLGMLPINDTITRRGEGFVNFSFKPKSSTITGDTVLAQAAIVFDVNGAIYTNEYSNIIDAQAPNSQLKDNLPDILDSTNIHLSWTAQDDPGGCGVRDYILFVANNGGPFLVHQSNILDTFFVFRGTEGATYSFFTSAVDHVGNIEPYKAKGELTVSISGSPAVAITGFDKNKYCAGDSLVVNWIAKKIQALDILISSTGQSGAYQPIGQMAPATDSLFKWVIPSSFPGCNPCFVVVKDTTTSTLIAADTLQTIIYPLPKVMAGGISAICVGDFGQLQASGATKYNWMPSTYLSSTTAAAPFVSPSTPTGVQYILIGTDEKGCANRDTINLSVSDVGRTFFYSGTCDPTSVGTSIDTLTNSAGCDSLLLFITLPDTMPPAAICQNTISLPLDSVGNAALSIEQVNNGSNDNCSISLLLSKTTFNCSDIGSNTITLTVSDRFNNIATCQSNITVFDPNLPPACDPSDTIPCGPGRVPILTASVTYHPTYGMSDGTAQATYTGGVEPVALVWSDDTPGALLSQVPPGEYWITATDANGCSAETSVTLAPTPRGRVIWSADQQQGVQNVTVMQTGDGNGEQLTGSDGRYVFDPIFAGTHFTLQPAKTSGKLQGVSVADAVMIQRHVTLADTLQAPYELIAGDVNGSKSISGLDAALVSQCLLNNPIACNLWFASWRFLDAAHTFPNPLQPWVFPEKIELYPSMMRTGEGLDFIGVKIGDVLNSGANPSLRSQALVVQVPDLHIKNNEEIVVPVRAFGYRDVTAYQFALDFDPAVLTLEGVETPIGSLLDADHFGLWQAETGEIRIAYASPDAATLKEGAELFSMRFRPRQSDRNLSALLVLKEDALPAQAYGADLSPRPLLLQFDRAVGIAEPAPADLLLTAQPNPALGSTRVRFTLPESCSVRLRVSEAGGRVIQEIKESCAAGLHEREIELPLSGVYLIEVMTPDRVGRVRVVSAKR